VTEQERLERHLRDLEARIAKKQRELRSAALAAGDVPK
jgi:hypothetical protein